MSNVAPRMSDIETLHDRLSKLVHGSEAISGKSRDLMLAGADHPSEAMRAEIAETHLLRRMVFRNDRNEELALEVASGRILRVSQPTSHHLQASLPEIAAQDLSRLSENQISQLAAVLSEFTADLSKLSVEVQILKTAASGPVLGLATNDLFQGHGKPRPPRTNARSTDFMSDFVRDCAPISTAALLMVGDTITVEQGVEAHLESLKTLARAERVANGGVLQGEADSESAGQCVIFSGHPDAERSILCASQSDSLAILFLNGDVLDEVLNLWMSHSG